MIISHIVAMSENRVIGRDGGMPWHIPEDFRHFKKTTMGHAMIMGRKTWDSIGRCLPGRLTIVVTRNRAFSVPPEVVIKPSINDAIEYCKAHTNQWGDECFIVGGGEIYRQSQNITDRIYLTTIHTTVSGDTSYPEFSSADFQQVKSEAHLDAPLPFTFSTWERIRK